MVAQRLLGGLSITVRMMQYAGHHVNSEKPNVAQSVGGDGNRPVI